MVSSSEKVLQGSFWCQALLFSILLIWVDAAATVVRHQQKSVAAPTTSTELLRVHLSGATWSHPDTVPRQYRLKETALSSWKANLGDRMA